MLKRLSLENLLLSPEETEQFIAGTAAEFLLKPQDVIETEQLLNILYARVLDNDLIIHSERLRIINRLREFWKNEGNDEKTSLVLSEGEISIVTKINSGFLDNERVQRILIFGPALLAAVTFFLGNGIVTGNPFESSARGLLSAIGIFIISLTVIYMSSSRLNGLKILWKK